MQWVVITHLNKIIDGIILNHSNQIRIYFIKFLEMKIDNSEHLISNKVEEKFL
jgi:hypothetical protein